MPPAPETSDPEILAKFIDLLRKNEPLTLPRETLLGAISHFISTLSAPNLKPLLEAISVSSHLWDTPNHRKGAREAVQLGIGGAVARLTSQPGPSRWWRRKDAASAWLNEVAATLMGLQGQGREDMLVCLIGAVGSESAPRGPVQWKGKARDNVEDEVVMELARRLDAASTTSAPPEGGSMVPEAVLHVDANKLRVLDTPALLSALLSSLGFSLSRSIETEIFVADNLSHAIARFLNVMNEGDVEMRQAAWSGMRQLCSETRRAISSSDPPGSPMRLKGDNNIQSAADHQNILSTFLVPANAILDILLHFDSPSPTSSTSSSATPSHEDVATDTLLTLSAFASLLDNSEGVEGYHRVLHGMTDVLVGTGGPAGIRAILSKAPAVGSMTSAEGAWWMSFGESVIGEVDQWGVDMVLEPLISRFIANNHHTSSFEAAHSLRLATIQARSKSLKSSDRAAFQDQVVQYSDLLLRQHLSGQITSDQFRAAYPLLIESASRHSETLLNTTLDLLRLSPAPGTAPDVFGQTRRIVLIAAAPHIPPNRLRTYLDSLVTEIMATAQTSPERVELTGAAFKMVIRDLGDGVRRVGMGWWSQWRDKFEHGEQGEVRAKL